MMEKIEIYDRMYMVFSTSEINTINFNEVYENSKDTLRFSINKLKTFVKWDGNTIPNSVNILESKEGPYNYSKILEILSTEEWNDPTLLTINNI